MERPRKLGQPGSETGQGKGFQEGGETTDQCRTMVQLSMHTVTTAADHKTQQLEFMARYTIEAMKPFLEQTGLE